MCLCNRGKRKIKSELRFLLINACPYCFWFLVRTAGEKESDGREYVKRKMQTDPQNMIQLGLLLFSIVKTDRDGREKRQKIKNSFKN